jgi:xanthine dehydrogenase iron-sulfur cluster and FAD-binding subunit A
MRLQAIFLSFVAGTANAASLEVAVSQGGNEPQKFSYPLTSERQTLDLRDSGRYTVAIKDKTRGKEICREAEYRTGMVMTLRRVDGDDPDSYKVEVVGQVSNLKALDRREQLACGVNMQPVIENAAFSDTSVLVAGKPKVLVVDGKTTLLLTVKE